MEFVEFAKNTMFCRINLYLKYVRVDDTRGCQRKYSGRDFGGFLVDFEHLQSFGPYSMNIWTLGTCLDVLESYDGPLQD